ncbi:MAG: imidazoleglycerol-phosphate dehydratase HisB [Planctomycetota bacterium]
MLYTGQIEGILFDMDGVLVDVSASYRMAIERTAEYYLKEKINSGEIQEYKTKSGYNNDWDITEAILLARGLKVPKDEIIKTFQGFYLGADFDGLITNEKWLLDIDILSKIKQDYKLGIVTGRPRGDAGYTLERFGVNKYFNALITMDDVEGRQKPDPYGINLALKELNIRRAVYAGDNIDDIKSAVSAGGYPGRYHRTAYREQGEGCAIIQGIRRQIHIKECQRYRGGIEMRKATIERNSKETQIKIKLNIDGSGQGKIVSEIGFLNHLLETLAKHGLFDIEARIKGDIHVDQHHIVEDTGIALGAAFKKALSDKKGIKRAGFFIYPMDESLVMAAVDISGRPYLKIDANFRNKKVGEFATDSLEDFFQGFVSSLAANLHIRVYYGRSDHHKIEAVFKAFAKSLKEACEQDKRLKNRIPSTKGML